MRTCRCSALFVLLVCAGCLQPVTPVPSASDSLSDKISTSLRIERQATAALANQVAITPAEADQKTLWLTNREKITTKAATDITTAIKTELGKAKDDPEAISQVWKEVAKGYGSTN